MHGLWLLLLLAECAADQAHSAGANEVGAATAAWSEVLEKYVDGAGRVNFAALDADRHELDRYVAWIGATGPANRPALFPTRAHVLAYHLNAYNALAMAKVLAAGMPDDLTGWRKFRFFLLGRIRVGGDTWSLYSYENQVIRSLGEPRIHFALNCMVVGCPRLPQTPFVAEDIEQQLDRAAREFLNDPRNVRIDRMTHTVRLSAIMDFYTEDFLRAANSLTAYVNRYRNAYEQVPENYEINFMPYDWTVNRQGRAQERAKR